MDTVLLAIHLKERQLINPLLYMNGTKNNLVSRKWAWTSITRARDLNKVKLFVNPKDDDIDDLTEDKLVRNLEKSVINKFKTGKLVGK